MYYFFYLSAGANIVCSLFTYAWWSRYCSVADLFRFELVTELDICKMEWDFNKCSQAIAPVSGDSVQVLVH